MNKTTKLLILATLALTVGACKKGSTSSDGPDLTSTLKFGVSEYGMEVKTAGVANAISQFADEDIALYAVKYNINEPITWPVNPADCFINTQTAHVITNLSDPKVGELVYYATDPLVFPESRVAVYALSPVTTDAGVIVTPQASQAPSATVELKTSYRKQYDVMSAALPYIKRESLSKGGRAELEFTHTLGMLKLQVYADATVLGPRHLTKVIVNANTKADIEDISAPVYSNTGTPGDFELYVAQKDEHGQVTATTVPQGTDATESVLLDGEVMLFPGSVKSITATIDSNDYTFTVPADQLSLAAGKTTTLTLKLTPLTLQLGGFTVGAWDQTTNISDVTQVYQRLTNFSVSLLKGGAITTPYAETGKFEASVQINNIFWLEEKPSDMLIPCTLTDGVLSFDKAVETLMLTNDPIELTALKLYKDGVLLFDSKITADVTPKMIIANDEKGTLKLENGPAITLYTDFGGFGNGTAAFPFEVLNENQLAKVKEFCSATPVSKFNFKQLADLDITSYQGGWEPIGTSAAPFRGWYDGNGKTIKGLTISRSAQYQGLFGCIGAANPATDVVGVTNLTLRGSVTSTGTATSTTAGVAGFVGAVTSGTFEISKCVNNVAVSSGTTCAGGFVGWISSVVANATMSQLINNGTVTSPTTFMGGLVGHVNSALVMSKCENKANITNSGAASSSEGVGGLIGNIGAPSGSSVDISIVSCYNSGAIASSSVGTGGIIGSMWRGTYTLTNLGNSGAITIGAGSPTMTKCGGLVGSSNSGAKVTLTKSYNQGTLTVTNRSQIGGLLGANVSQPFEITDCYNTGIINANVATSLTLSVGGLNGNGTGYLKITNCYVSKLPNIIGNSVVNSKGVISGALAPAIANSYYDTTMGAISGWNLSATQIDLKTNGVSRLGGDWMNDNSNVNGGYPTFQWVVDYKANGRF